MRLLRHMEMGHMEVRHMRVGHMWVRHMVVRLRLLLRWPHTLRP